ncbi:hypothetical protein SNK04_013822 [Fusarium graminearum]
MNQIVTIEDSVYGTKDSFASVLTDRSINLDREAEFALQTLYGNDYAMKIAMQNRSSVIAAVVNIAAIGISLNPAKKQAYLVPRDGKICLDISYMGLMDLAIDSGSIRWGRPSWSTRMTPSASMALTSSRPTSAIRSLRTGAR